MNIAVNKIVESSKGQLYPEKWMELYFDDFYIKAMSFLDDKASSLEIIKKTFFTALNNKNEYRGLLSERQWLFNFLNEQIKNHVEEVSFKINKHAIFNEALKNAPTIQIEAFKLKTYYKERTETICKKLKISEELFWSYIHQTRSDLMLHLK